MRELAIFIAGMVFVSFIYPCLDAISTHFQNWLGTKTIKLQVVAEKLKAEIDQTPVHAIGFQYNGSEEDKEDWEEDDED